VYAIACGGFGDVWKGSLQHRDGVEIKVYIYLKTVRANFISSYIFQVAVKVLRLSIGASREKVIRVGRNFLH
jgi:hypothetical protein